MNHDHQRRNEHEGLTRRRLLRQGAAGALSAGAVAQLAACGDPAEAPTGPSSRKVAKREIARTLMFANRPDYIDVDEKVKRRPTLDKFRRRYGTRVKYVEEVNGDRDFFRKVSPSYARRDSDGRDIHVVADWMAARMTRLGYAQRFDKAEMPTAARNLEPALARPDFDPRREYSMPWQSRQAGVIYRRDLTGADLGGYSDLLAQRFAGRVTVLPDMRPTVGAVLLLDGIEPERASKDQALAAIERIERAVADGRLRASAGYAKELLAGASVAALGWSDVAVGLAGERADVRFAAPGDGFVLSTDSMQIPVGAPHAYTAQKLIDFVYDPEIQAAITAYVHCVPPVAGTRAVVERTDPELAASPLVFPDLSKAHGLRTFPARDERELEQAFRRAIAA